MIGGGTNSNCVEYARLPATVALRDSKNPTHGHLTLPSAEWAAFLGAIRREEL
ncbi:DUF397 domain-containing protein [Marinactinospora rubrisoli]|uniref:DUF397 domain-containing protein n=1 Tax=Marinactinospora rubrisoli TaxID=2715399 RepID=A0ABW2KIZ1_9ACTN